VAVQQTGKLAGSPLVAQRPLGESGAATPPVTDSNVDPGPYAAPHTGATPACADSQVNLCEGSIVAAGSEQQTAATRPKTRLQNNITQPKSFGDDFVHLVTNTGEPRDFA
jgi:hypothetical protein